MWMDSDKCVYHNCNNVCLKKYILLSLNAIGAFSALVMAEIRTADLCDSEGNLEMWFTQDTLLSKMTPGTVIELVENKTLPFFNVSGILYWPLLLITHLLVIQWQPASFLNTYM